MVVKVVGTGGGAHVPVDGGVGLPTDAREHEVGTAVVRVVHHEAQTRRREVAHDVLVVGVRERKGAAEAADTDLSVKGESAADRRWVSRSTGQ